MTRRVSSGTQPVTLATRIPVCLARRHSHRCRLRQTPNLPSTFLRSLRSLVVTPLRRYYGRSDSCPPVSWTLAVPNACSTCGQVSLIHVLDLPSILSPTTCGCFVSPRHVPCRWIGPRPHPSLGSSPSGISGLRHWLVDSPHHTGRIEFLTVRTGRSPPVASHHASRRDLALQRDRSYVRLQVYVEPEEDSHLFGPARSQTHWPTA
jgi:hypothetical protein